MEEEVKVKKSALIKNKKDKKIMEIIRVMNLTLVKF